MTFLVTSTNYVGHRPRLQLNRLELRFFLTSWLCRLYSFEFTLLHSCVVHTMGEKSAAPELERNTQHELQLPRSSGSDRSVVHGGLDDAELRWNSDVAGRICQLRPI